MAECPRRRRWRKGDKILEDLKAMSGRLGTRIAIENGVGVIRNSGAH